MMPFKIEKIALPLFFVAADLLLPDSALAHGDPRALFSMSAIALIDLSIPVFILVSKTCSGARMPSLCLYLTSSSTAWLWGLEYTGFELSEMYLKLFLPPLLTFTFVVWLCRKAKHK